MKEMHQEEIQKSLPALLDPRALAEPALRTPMGQQGHDLT